MKVIWNQKNTMLEAESIETIFFCAITSSHALHKFQKMYPHNNFHTKLKFRTNEEKKSYKDERSSQSRTQLLKHHLRGVVGWVGKLEMFWRSLAFSFMYVDYILRKIVTTNDLDNSLARNFRFGNTQKSPRTDYGA